MIAGLISWLQVSDSLPAWSFRSATKPDIMVCQTLFFFLRFASKLFLLNFEYQPNLPQKATFWICVHVILFTGTKGIGTRVVIMPSSALRRQATVSCSKALTFPSLTAYLPNFHLRSSLTFVVFGIARDNLRSLRSKASRKTFQLITCHHRHRYVCCCERFF